MRGGRLFENFSAPQREDLWSKVCNASKRCLVPSLFTFFEDRKFLSDATACIRKILDVGRKDTIAGCLEEVFSDAKQTADRCVIQLSEESLGSVVGNVNSRLDFGIRQLWLAAFRNYKDLPADAQKKGLLALSRTKADEPALYELASLASRLGFESDKLDEILQKSSDRSIAENALLTARKPGRYVFRNSEECIQKILDAFAAAVPASVSETSNEADDDIRELEQPPQRCGRPNDLDYEHDKSRLFLPQMHDEIDVQLGEMTSTFVRWSVYCAYFGTPPSLGTITTDISPAVEDVEMTGDVPAQNESERGANVRNYDRPITMPEEDLLPATTGLGLQLEQARRRDASRELQDMKLTLKKLAQDEASLQARLDENNQQILLQNARLEDLRQESAVEQQRLDQLKAKADRTQTQVPTEEQAEMAKKRGGESRQTIQVGEPAPRPVVLENAGVLELLTPAASVPEAHTQLLLRRTDRHTQFNFQEFMAHNPNKEHVEAMAAITEEAGTEENEAEGSEPKETIRIDFVNVESGDKSVISDSLVVDPTDSNAVLQVQRLATSYMRKSYYLFDKERNKLNTTDCFRKAVDDGTHTIVLQHRNQVNGVRYGEDEDDGGRSRKH